MNEIAMRSEKGKQAMPLHTKRDLYDQVQFIRDTLRLSDSAYPLDMIAFINTSISNLSVGLASFHTKGFQGMLKITPEIGKNSVILLNDCRTRREQNFDCAHEFMHYCLHGSDKTQTFRCFDNTVPTQYAYREWQANEGAAELLVPFSQFAPCIKAHHRDFYTLEGLIAFREWMAGKFGVTPIVIRTRLDSMRYEIFQYLSGTPLSEIELLSGAQQKARKISVGSLNDAEDESFERAHAWMVETGPKKYRKVLS